MKKDLQYEVLRLSDMVWLKVEKHFYDLMEGTEQRRIIATPLETGRHPEDYCQRCGGKNVVWSAPNKLFNEINGASHGIICPQCFEEAAKVKGIAIKFIAITF